MITSIRDVDREILNKLNDKDFLKMYSLNRTYYYKVCDETYFRIRTETRYPETIPYKDYIEVTNWKDHYLIIIKYIFLLQKEFNYEYKAEDKSPELYYLARRLVPKCVRYNNNISLIWASADGHLEVVKYLVEQGADITAEDNYSVRRACANGHLEILKYLVENGANIHACNDSALRRACENGHLPIAEYLVENGADIDAQNDYILRWTDYYEHLLKHKNNKENKEIKI